MNILIAPDKFKGTLSALEASQIIAAEIKIPGANPILLPMADGGEGTARAVASHLSMERRTLPASDPLMRPIPGGASYYINPASREVAIDSSTVIGLGLVSDIPGSPLRRTSFPLGRFISDIMATESPSLLYIGVGGTATTDAGAGMLQALGYKFFSGRRMITEPILPTMFPHIDRAVPPAHLDLPPIKALADVSVPLTAPSSSPSSLTFASQKGATPADIDYLRSALGHWASLFKPTGSNFDGAGGGLGHALAILGARLTYGAREVLAMSHPDTLSPDVVITGEGSVDEQTSLGKVVGTMADYCDSRHIPCIIIGGRISLDFNSAKVALTISTQQYPPHGCLNSSKAKSRLTAASRDACEWIKQNVQLSSI